KCARLLLRASSGRRPGWSTTRTSPHRVGVGERPGSAPAAPSGPFASCRTGRVLHRDDRRESSCFARVPRRVGPLRSPAGPAPPKLCERLRARREAARAPLPWLFDRLLAPLPCAGALLP